MDDFFDFDDDDSLYDQSEWLPESNIKIAEIINVSFARLEDNLPYSDEDVHVYDFVTSFVQTLNDFNGMPGIFMLMQAVEKETGWALEIVGSQSEIEQYAFNKYDMFDESLWIKVKNSEAWDSMVREIYAVTAEWMPVVVAESLSQKLPLKHRLKKAFRSLKPRY